jgi:hypothetical protein
MSDSNIAIVNAFVSEHKSQFGYRKICKALEKLPWERYDIKGISRAPLRGIAHAQILDVSQPSTLSEVNALLEKGNLVNLTEFQIIHGVHYGVYNESNELVTVVSTTTYMINSPFKIILSIDALASTDPGHSACDIVERIKAVVSKRQQKSYVITQAANTKDATDFWRGRLTISGWGSVFVGLINIRFPEYLIYCDANAMIS